MSMPRVVAAETLDGLAEDDPRCADPAQWLGLNLLGFALMGIPGYLSMRFIEMPFLRMRRRYLRA